MEPGWDLWSPHSESLGVVHLMQPLLKGCRYCQALTSTEVGHFPMITTDPVINLDWDPQEQGQLPTSPYSLSAVQKRGGQTTNKLTDR